MVYLKLILTAVFWGGTFIAGRIVARDVPPFTAAFLRFACASLLLAVLAWRIGGRLPRPNARQGLALVFLGLTGVFAYNVFFFMGLKIIQAGRSAVIIALNPVFITLCAALFLRERLTLLRTGGVLLSVCGAVLVIARGDIPSLFAGQVGWGEAYIFGCVLSWVSFSLVGKVILKDFSPLVAITYASWVGTLALAAFALKEGLLRQWAHYPVAAWLGILYLGGCGTVLGFVWYYEGIQRIGPSRAGQFINFVPVSAILIAWWLLGESLTASLIIGTLLVSLGVYLTNAAPRAPSVLPTDRARH